MKPAVIAVFTALAGLCAIPLPAAPAADAATSDAATFGAAKPAGASTAARKAPSLDALFTGDYKETSARDVILDIARSAGMNAVLPSPLDGNITAHIDRMPVREALELVTGLAGADYRVMDGTIYVLRRGVTARPAETASSAESEVERIASRIDAQDAAAYQRSRPRPSEAAAPIVVEATVNIQSSAPTMPMPVFPPDWPVFGGVVYAPLGGVRSVSWSPGRVTRIPGGILAPPWGNFGPRW